MLRQMSHWLQGVGVGPVLAVQRLGQDPGGRGLAHAAGAGEQIGVADAVGGDRVRTAPGRRAPGRSARRTSAADSAGRRRHSSGQARGGIRLRHGQSIADSLWPVPDEKPTAPGTDCLWLLRFRPDQVHRAPLRGLLSRRPAQIHIYSCDWHAIVKRGLPVGTGHK